MKKMVFARVLMLSLGLVFMLILVPSVRAVSENLLVNGDFETGTLSGWDVVGVCSISSTVVHSGSYSAYISDAPTDNWMGQEVNLPADDDYHLEGWIYPLRVGSLGPLLMPYSLVSLWYYDKASMMHAFHVNYIWSWNDAEEDPTVNDSNRLTFLLSFNQSEWNLLSRNVTQEVRQYFTGINLSEYVLHNITAWYHYSNVNPGAFYLDDLRISTPKGENPLWTQWYFWTNIALGTTTAVFAFTAFHYWKKALTTKESKSTVAKPLSRESKTCPNCGANLPADSKFCGKCGTSLE